MNALRSKCVVALLTCASSAAWADSQTNLPARIQQIVARPGLEGARWGMDFQLLDGGRSIHSVNAQELFVAGSAAKVFVAGTAFAALGAEHRFRTTVYGTGPIVDDVLEGDLILVAGGDLLLSSRMQPDGTLALPQPDHSYDRSPGAGPVPGDPLQVIRQLAGQLAARQVKRIRGRVIVDASLFREGLEDVGMGAEPIRISPIMINDNIVDITVMPGRTAGTPATLHVSPQTAYLQVVNEVRTVDRDAQGTSPLTFTQDTLHADGTRTVRLTGEVPAADVSSFRAYFVREPVVFAQIVFAEALRDWGIIIEGARSVDRAIDGAFEAKRRLPLARHVSPPLWQQAKVMLKISSNVHTVMFPYLVGAIAGGDGIDAKGSGTQIQRSLLQRAGLDPDAQGTSEYRFNADYFVTFLAHMARRPDFRKYRETLPIMGRDGSLADVQADSPAAGHVYAKTGTGIGRASPSSPPMLHKALAGYLQLPNGCWVAFAQFMELEVSMPAAGTSVENLAAEVMGEIVTAVYESFESTPRSRHLHLHDTCRRRDR